MSMLNNHLFILYITVKRNETRGVVCVGTSSQLKSKQVIYDSLAYHYAIKCLNEDNTNVNKYIKKQCQQFIECIDSEEYYIDIKSGGGFNYVSCNS